MEVIRNERAYTEASEQIDIFFSAGPSDEDIPFVVPFKDPPVPDTWLMAQPYGNTISAYRQRDVIYGRSQGIHFGVDFSARCGTEIVALAAGVVFAIDNLNFGSAPHNLIIDHLLPVA